MRTSSNSIWKQQFWLWKTSDDRLAAVLHPDGAGEAFLQVHPAFHTLDLDVEMILAAETQYATTQSEGSQRLIIWVHETDLLRQDLLKRRGYLKEKFRGIPASLLPG